MAIDASQLRAVPDFAELPDKELEALASSTKLITVDKGAFVFKRGKTLDGIYILLDVTVDLIDANFNIEIIEGGTSRSAMPLTEISPSPVAAKAKTNLNILLFNSDAYIEFRQQKDDTAKTKRPLPPPDDERWLESLSTSPMFSRVPPTQLQRLFVSLERIGADAGEEVVREGSPGEYFYFIESGEASVVSRVQGDITTLVPGQFFGEEALVGDTIRNATVKMKTDGVLMRLGKADFKDLLQEPLLRYIKCDEIEIDPSAYCLVDVRLPVEHREVHAKNSINIPLSSLRKRLVELDQGKTYVVTDDAGKRTEVAAHLLTQAGFNTFILKGAVDLYTKACA